MVGRATPHEAEHLDHLSPGFLLYPNQGRNFNLTRLDHLLVNWELTATAAVLRQFSGVARDSILCATMSLTAPIDAAVMACTYTIINHTSMTPLTCRRHQFTKPDLTFVLRGLSASCRRYLWHHKFFSQNVTCQALRPIIFKKRWHTYPMPRPARLRACPSRTSEREDHLSSQHLPRLPCSLCGTFPCSVKNDLEGLHKF